MWLFKILDNISPHNNPVYRKQKESTLLYQLCMHMIPHKLSSLLNQHIIMAHAHTKAGQRKRKREEGLVNKSASPRQRCESS